MTRRVQRLGPPDEHDKYGKLAADASIEALADRRPPSGSDTIGLDTLVMTLVDQRLVRLAEDDRSARTLDTYRYDASKLAKFLGGVKVGGPPCHSAAGIRHRRARRAPMLNPRSLSARAFIIPKGMTQDDYNREDVQVIEMPASNGIGSARSVAKAYGSAATGGSDLGLAATTLDALALPAVPPTNGLRDKVMHIDTVFSLGYFKPFPQCRFGSSDKGFGTPGLGGSFGFADPDTGIGFGYVMNRLGFHPWSDPRQLALRHTLFHDVLGARPQT